MIRLCDTDRVLVRAPSWLGDFVMAEPLVRALHRRLVERGSGAITLCGPARLLELFEGRFQGSRRLPFEQRESERAELWRGHDLALLLNGSWRSAWSAWRARTRERIGFARDGKGVLLTLAATPARERGARPFGVGAPGRFPRWLPRPFGAVCAELASWVGLEVPEGPPVFASTAGGRERALRRLGALGLARGDGFILVNAARRPGSAKGLGAETWVPILEALAQANAFPLLVHAAPGEEAEARVALAARGGTRARLFADPQPDLAELLALIAAARCYVTPDSGPRHLATAVGTPCAVLFGPTDPRHTAQHLARTRGLRVELACSPCHRERCPLRGEEHEACMRRIAPERVASAVRELLLLDRSPAAP